jgi:hypothetical protein
VAQDREVLAGIREAHPDDLGQVADAPLPRPERLEDHQPLGVSEDLAQLGVKSERLGVPASILLLATGLILQHGQILPILA